VDISTLRIWANRDQSAPQQNGAKLFGDGVIQATPSERILTSHAGSLPRPPDLLALANAEPRDQKRYAECLTTAVKDIVDWVIDDGEYGKPDFAVL
jgi:hypothetical protein